MLNVFFNATPLLGPRTGIGRYCEQLMTAVSQVDGIAPHFFYKGVWAGLNVKQSTLASSFARKQVLSVSERWPSIANAAYTIRHKVNEIKFNQGLVNGTGVYHEPNFFSYKTNLPTVLTVHDLSVLRFPETHPAYRVAVFNKRLSDSVDRADIIITDSDFVGEEVIQEFSVSRNKVVSVPLAASTIFSPSAPESLRLGLNQLGLPKTGYLLAVGTLEPRKNIANAIRAYSRLPKELQRSFPFVITGMRGWRNGELDREAENLIAQGRIILTGFVPDELLQVLYCGATVFVYPSLYEGFGLPPLEAMACGTPVVVSDNSSIAEVVSNAGLKVDCTDIDALSDAISSLLENDSIARKLSVLGLARSREFSWDKCARQTVDVYRQVVN